MYKIDIDENSKSAYSNNTQLDLLHAVQNGDVSAEERLVKNNFKLVVFIAKKYGNTSLELDDLINTGAIGLIKSIRSYDENKNTKFATYACKCIENEIRVSLRKEKKHKEVSLYKTIVVNNNNDDLTYEDILYDNCSATNHFEELESRQDIKKVLLKLEKDQKKIIELYFGFNDQPCMSQEKIAEVIGCSRANVSRIVRRLLIDIRDELIANYGYVYSKKLDKIKK